MNEQYRYKYLKINCNISLDKTSFINSLFKIFITFIFVFIFPFNIIWIMSI